jgi:hypothetical protein
MQVRADRLAALLPRPVEPAADSGRHLNLPRGQILAILSLVATAGLPVLLLLMRLKIFTFRDDFTGFNALGFVLTWTLVLLLAGTLLGGLAWRADRPRKNP